MHLWATGRLDYIPDNEVFSSWGNVARVAAGIFLVPMYRDLHFYFAHRFIHMRALYKYIHSLHHRNTSIEPFSGLCMHPVEHLYYVSCMILSLYIKMSPLQCLANGMHLTLSPAASHSGWEDHWQSDQFHYLHHAKFECNYGTTSVPYDKWFGTYSDVFTPAAAKSEQEQEQQQQKQPQNKSAKKSYVPSGGLSLTDAIPTTQNVIYFMITCFIFAFTAWACVNERMFFADGRVTMMARAVALLTAVGPLVSACLLWYFSKDSLQFFWPFHKENNLVFAGHTLVSTLMCIVPVYQMVLCTLSSTPVDYTLWGI